MWRKEEKDRENGGMSQTRKTEQGVKVYTEEQLGIGKGNFEGYCRWKYEFMPV